MIERKTMLDQVELTRNGAVNIRLALCLVEGDVELHTTYHRVSIDINGDVVAQMAEVVTHLGEQGFPPLPESALQLLRSGHQLIKDYLGYVAPDLGIDAGSGTAQGDIDPADGAGDPGKGSDSVGV